MKYQVTAPFIELHSGVLTLTKEQARDRQHCLKKVKKDTYEIVKPVQFKQGEEIGYDGELTYQLADALDAKVQTSASDTPPAGTPPAGTPPAE